MSDSEREKDIWKLRQLSKQKNELFTYPCSSEEASRIRKTTEYLLLQTEFNKLMLKYGNNPEIFKDDARSGPKRTAALRNSIATKRAKKRSEKQKCKTNIGNDENEKA